MRLSWQNVALEWNADWAFLKDSVGSEYRKDFDFAADGQEGLGLGGSSGSG